MSDIRSNEVRREEIGRRQQSAIEMARIKRNNIIEECARKIDQMVTAMTKPDYVAVLEAAAETIRDLKDRGP